MNATKLCKAAGKQFGHWKSLDSTKAYLEALSSDIGIPISGKNGLIQVRKGVRKGSKPEDQGSGPSSMAVPTVPNHGQPLDPGVDE